MFRLVIASPRWQQTQEQIGNALATKRTRYSVAKCNDKIRFAVTICNCYRDFMQQGEMAGDAVIYWIN
jgi:hypothetical protein